jgi:hypothetical protein
MATLATRGAFATGLEMSGVPQEGMPAIALVRVGGGYAAGRSATTSVRANDQSTASASIPGSGGKGACGSDWYQSAVLAMSSSPGR